MIDKLFYLSLEEARQEFTVPIKFKTNRLPLQRFFRMAD